MKKIVLVFFVLFSLHSFGQDKFRIGINSGITLSHFRGNDLVNRSNSGLGFLVGLDFEYSLKEKLSLRTNVSYETKSIVYKTIVLYDNFGAPTGKNTKIKSTYDYITIPILVKYSFDNKKSFFINGGPFLGFLLNAKSKAESVDSNNFTSLNKNLDYGLSFGIGKRFNLNEKNDLNIEIRDNLGLVNTSAVKVINDGTIKTNSVNLILGWSFGI
jgi:hypothetical protein